MRPLTKLHALEKMHWEAGRHVRADRIRFCNLGRVKIDAHRQRTQKKLRTVAFQAAHSVVDKSAVVVSEDLASPITRKSSWGRQYNRRMGSWAKGVLAEALDSVCTQRQAEHRLVNEVKRILLTRSPAELTIMGLELRGKPRQPSADKSNCTDLYRFL